MIDLEAIEYYLAREQHALGLEAAAKDPGTAAIHRYIAAQYAAIVEQLRTAPEEEESATHEHYSDALAQGALR